MNPSKALKELRKILPDATFLCVTQESTATYGDGEIKSESVALILANTAGAFRGATLTEALEKVRAWRAENS